jgi:CHASE2 domain-containing sensor protein
VNFKDTLLRNWRAKLLGGGVVAILGVICLGLIFTQGLDHLSYDLPFAFRGGIHTDEALIIYMDDESRQILKQPVDGPWDRAKHTELLTNLLSLGAKAVVFDVLFDEPWTNKTVDANFADAIKAHHGHVVLGERLQHTGGNGKPDVLKLDQPVEPLKSAGAWGVANFYKDTDGTVRKHYYDPAYTSLAWQTAKAAGVEIRGKEEEQRWLNYYGPKKTIPSLEYYQVLQSAASFSGKIADKVVFVGNVGILKYRGSEQSDEIRTPYTRWTGESSPGVDVQATAFLNLARGDWLERLPLPVELGLIVGPALALGFLLPSFRPGMAFAVGAGAALMATVAGLILALQFHEWFCWAVIPGIEVPAALVWFSMGVLNQRAAERQIIRFSEDESEEVPADGPPRIPEHEMLRPFAEGSYGQVWLARSSTFGSYRAVKVVSRSTFQDDGPFEREFRGIQLFEPISRTHDGFVDILQVGRREKAGYFYYIMELADDLDAGEVINPNQYVPRTLGNDLKKRGRIPCRQSVQIGLLLAGALSHLHRSGLIHRDIKPSNIIFVKGVPKFADIGLVTAAVDASSYVGTEGFLPPEGPGTPQADIYSLGKVLYEIAMGRDRLCFPELPTTFAEDPEREHLQSLNAIIIKACREVPTRRYATAEKMQSELKRLANRFKSAKSGE